MVYEKKWIKAHLRTMEDGSTKSVIGHYRKYHYKAPQLKKIEPTYIPKYNIYKNDVIPIDGKFVENKNILLAEIIYVFTSSVAAICALVIFLSIYTILNIKNINAVMFIIFSSFIISILSYKILKKI